MSSTSHYTAVCHCKSDYYTALVDNHQIVVVCYVLDSYQSACLFRDVERLHTLTATVGYAIVDNIRTFAVALLTHNHHGLMLWVVDYNHSDQSIVTLIEAHTANTCRSTSHGTNLVFIETNCTSITVGKNQLVMTIGQTNIYNLVSLYDIDSDHTVGTRARVCFQTSLLDCTILGSKYHIMVVDEFCIIQTSQAEECVHLVIALNIEQVLDGASL